MSGYKKEQGKYGEELASAFLKKLGYEIIVKNYLIRGGEIDLIARDGETTVIVEVKLRGNNEYGPAVESVTHSKLRALIKTSKFYALEKKINGGLRIDLVAIDIKDGKPRVTHLKNITEGFNTGF